MTTHYQKIQALGNRMASNLETMGVSASFNDGGLTLADKILQIQHFTNGLILYADKDIAQKNDTVNFYALLLNDSKPLSGEKVKIYADAPLRTVQISGNGNDIYDDYFVTSTKTGSYYDYIGTGSSGFIQFNSTKLNTYTSGYGTEVTHNGYIHIKDGVLTYKDISNVAHTIDVSSITTTKSYGDSSFTVYYYWMEATTGSDGLASFEYTCKGAGKIHLYAVYSTFQSEIYSIDDMFYVDDGSSSSTLSRYTVYPNDGNSLTVEDDRFLFTAGTDQRYCLIDTNNASFNLSDFKGKCLNFKVNIKPSSNVRCQIRYNTGSWVTLDSDWVNTPQTLSLSQDIPSNATRVIIRVIEANNTGTTCELDNIRFNFS